MARSLPLAAEPGSVAVARHWSVAYADAHGFGGVSRTLSLLVSELVSNVVLHARTPCEVRIARQEGRLRVEVHDRSERLPKRSRGTDPLAHSGRGMILVEELSDAHGATALPDGGGKVVWFELAAGTEAGR